MAYTTSIVGTVSSAIFNDFLIEDGTISRIRDAQAPICSNFSQLSIPAGATIDGIEVLLKGRALDANHDTAVGDWIYVSNDGGSSWSTAQSITTGPWLLYGFGVDELELAGGASELWGLSWNATTAAAIQVKMAWSTTDGDAVFLDYVKVKVTYTAGFVVIPKSLTINGSLNVNGTLIIK
jgi:hypothetical protein